MKGVKNEREREREKERERKMEELKRGGAGVREVEGEEVDRGGKEGSRGTIGE